jgi:hypothetical protein
VKELVEMVVSREFRFRNARGERQARGGPCGGEALPTEETAGLHRGLKGNIRPFALREQVAAEDDQPEHHTESRRKPTTSVVGH